MSLLNPAIGTAPARRRQAASLSRTLSWHFGRLWQALERSGQRRAAPELHKLAERLASEGHEAAAHIRQIAREWSGR